MKWFVSHRGTGSLAPMGSGTLEAPPSQIVRFLTNVWQRLTDNRFVRNVVSNAGGSALNAVLQLGLLLLLSRFLSDASYAAWLTAASIIVIGESLSDFGTRLWAVGQFAIRSTPLVVDEATSPPTSPHGPHLTHDAATFRQCLYNKAFYTLCGAIVLSLLPLNKLDLLPLLLALGVAATQPSTDPLFWYLRGKDRLDIEAGITLASRIVQATLLIVAGWHGLPLEWLLGIWLAVNLGRMLMTFRLAICAPLRESLRSSDGRGTASAIRSGVAKVFPIGVSLVLAPFFTQAALLTLSMVGSDQEVNTFGTALRLVIAAGFIGTSVVVSSYPRLTEALGGDDFRKAQTIVDRMASLLVRVMLPICLLAIMLSVPVSGFLLPNDLTDVGYVMVLLVPGLYLSCVNMGAKYTLNAAGRNWFDVAAMVIGFVAFGGLFATLSFFVADNTAFTLNPVLVAGICWIGSELVVLCCRMAFIARRSTSEDQEDVLHFPAGLTLTSLAGLVVCSVAMYCWQQNLLPEILS